MAQFDSEECLYRRKSIRPSLVSETTCSSRPTLATGPQSSYLTCQRLSTRSNTTSFPTDSKTTVASLAQCSAGSRLIFGAILKPSRWAVPCCKPPTSDLVSYLARSSPVHCVLSTSASSPWLPLRRASPSMASPTTLKLGLGSLSNQTPCPTSRLPFPLFPPGAFTTSASSYPTASSSTSRRSSSFFLRLKARQPYREVGNSNFLPK